MTLPLPGRVAMICSAVGLALAVSGSASFAQQNAARIYYFVDELGVPHFTNAPADPRYKLYTGTETIATRTATPAARAPAAPPPVTVDQPAVPQQQEEEYGPNDR